MNVIYSSKLDHSGIYLHTQTNVVEEEGKTYFTARGDGCGVEEHVVFTGTKHSFVKYSTYMSDFQDK